MAAALPATQFTTASTPTRARANAAASVVSTRTLSTPAARLRDPLTGIAQPLSLSIVHRREPT